MSIKNSPRGEARAEAQRSIRNGLEADDTVVPARSTKLFTFKLPEAKL